MTKQDSQSTKKNCVTQCTFLVIITGHRNIKALTLNTIVNQNATSDLVTIFQPLSQDEETLFSPRKFEAAASIIKRCIRQEYYLTLLPETRKHKHWFVLTFVTLLDTARDKMTKI